MKIENDQKKGRGRPRRFDQETALAKALELFWERGFEATSMSELTEAMGMSPSSIYSTWGDKEGLFRAALNRYVEGPGSYLVKALSEPGTSRQAFARLFDRAADQLTLDGRPSGCMVALSGNQCSPEARPVGEALGEIRRLSREAMASRLRQGQKEGELEPGVVVDDLAGYFSTVLSGMSIQARDGADAERLRAIGQRAMQAWPDQGANP